MKNNKIYIPLVAAGMLFGSCNDLDQLPNTNAVTEGQKQEAVQANPSLAAAGVNALPSQLNSYVSLFGNHLDFGWPSCIIALECRGQDCISANVGYNWFTPALTLTDWNNRYILNYQEWEYNYYTIRSANNVIASIPEPNTPELKYYVAQALTFRANSYFYLAQIYQFTYARNPEAPCVPIITEENMDIVGTEGCPRSSVREVYERINEDLTNAIALFTDCEADGVSRSTMAESNNIVKTFANSTVAYGLRARANLFRCEYKAAASDAQKALELATAEGLSPYSIAEASVPAFTTLQDHNFIWGTYLDPSSSQASGIVTYASHFTGFQTNGYAGSGVYRRINKKLYESIPSTDVRKKWWLDGSGNYPSSLPAAYADYISSGYDAVGSAPFEPYSQLKIGNYQNTPSTIGAIDNPLLRVEELHLILAEAQGMDSPSAGAATLKSFVTTFRDPSYTCTPTSSEELRDLIWYQRRIELWGEGFAFWDLMRLQKGIDRRGAGFEPETVFLVAPDNPCLIYNIPQSEQQANPQIGEVTTGAVKPDPVDDEK